MIAHLVWFRNDLRVRDNKALFYACKDFNVKIIALFISTLEQWKKHDMSINQINFIYKNLLYLQKSLYNLGIPLIYQQCINFNESLNWLQKFCQRKKIVKIFYNKQYELNEFNRDKKLRCLLDKKILIYAFDDSVFFPPGSILNSKNEMYKIFTPFRNRCIFELNQKNIQVFPIPKIRRSNFIPIKSIPKNFNACKKLLKTKFLSGEKAALNQLKNFAFDHVKNYVKYRDIPSKKGTSRLSPYLSIGVLSPRQCFNSLKNQHPNLLLNNTNAASKWLNELIWREFYRHLIVGYPFLCKKKPFIGWTKKIKWNKNKNFFLAWKKGLTGYPIVDAGMRELNKTGWMHNRLRMITASFLVKDLHIDWRKGERYFMNKLIDGDFASNNGGWQWASSTGTDSVPYFRIFNPTTQGKRFDPKGLFIRRWIPELNRVPEKYIHCPHLWSFKYNLNLNYPIPIVNHSKNRKETLNLFNNAKNNFDIK